MTEECVPVQAQDAHNDNGLRCMIYTNLSDNFLKNTLKKQRVTMSSFGAPTCQPDTPADTKSYFDYGSVPDSEWGLTTALRCHPPGGRIKVGA